MAFHSLRARLLVIQSALVVGLTAVTLAYVSMRANRAVSERFTDDLTRSRDAIAAGRAGSVCSGSIWWRSWSPPSPS